MTQLLKISPKGQITIPKQAREYYQNNQLLFELKGKIIILHPVNIQLFKDELDDFHGLAEKSFDFWAGDGDDVYQNFYTKSRDS